MAPTLGTAAQFGVLGNSGVTGSAAPGTAVNGNVGSAPTAPTITNFGPSTVTAPFVLYTAADPVTAQAQIDAGLAYTSLAGQGVGTALGNTLSGTLTPGLYSLGAADLGASTTLTLNDPSSDKSGIFVFNVASTLTMNGSSVVTGTADPCNVYWRVGSSAMLNGTSFMGTVIADTSISTSGGGNVTGRLLAGAVTATGIVTMATGGNTIGGCSRAKLALAKTVVNTGGGSALASAFTLTATGPVTISGTAPVAATNAPVGAYTLTESGPAGYTAGSFSCSGGGALVGNVLTIAAADAGNTITCTITNTFNPPRLALAKTVVNTGGGSALASAFTLTATGPVTISGTAPVAATNAPVGAYTLTETGPAGYTAGSFSCSGGGALVGNVLTIAVADAGNTITCTITNTFNTPRLALTKTVVNTGGGSALASAFTLTATGPVTISGTAPVAATNAPVGAYTLAESGPAGYTAGSFSCSGGGVLVGSVLTIAAGDAGNTITCTIINTFNSPRLALAKTVVNTGGGTALASAFTLTATGPVTISGTAPVAATNAPVGVYTLTETGPTSYTAGLFSCSGGGALAGNLLTIAAADAGNTITCSITNTFNVVAPAQLALAKTVVNTGGGTALASAFTLTATGPTVISGTAPVAATNAPTGVYTLSETGPTSYTAGLFSCSGGGTLAANLLTITAADSGKTITCTITNTFNVVAPAQLALAKTVVNTGGGTALASAFTLTATGPTVISGTAPVAATNAPTGVYTLTESGPAGYTAGSFSCSGGGALVGNVLTIAVADAGNTITCTITNTFNVVPPPPPPPPAPARLALAKTVDNTGSGIALASAFTLTATGPVTISGTAPVAATNAPVGVYTLTESGPADYTAGLFSCSGGGALAGNLLTITAADAGNTITCTITNTFNPPRLALTKTVVNTGGGSALATAFLLTASGDLFTGPTLITGTTPVAATNAPVGVYTLTESGPAGYTAGSFSCSGGGTLVGNKLTIAAADAGNTITCTIVNTFTPLIAAKLGLLKTVVNTGGGSALATAFLLTATGDLSTGPTVITGTTPVTPANVPVGVYTLTESGPAGYTAGSFSCSGGGALVGNKLTISAADAGNTITCTIVNTFTPLIAAKLGLLKTVDNTGGGSALATAFLLTATGDLSTGPTVITGTTPVTPANVPVGVYTLTESGPAGYTAGSFSCSGGGALVGNKLTIEPADAGNTITCTIANTFTPLIAAKLGLLKTVVNTGGGSALATAFLLTATGDLSTGPTVITGTTPVTPANVPVGVYTLTESGPAGYTAGSFSCSGGGTLAGNLLTITAADAGNTIICTIANTFTPLIAAKLGLLKTVDNTGGGSALATAFLLTATGDLSTGPTVITGTTPVTPANVPVGVYTLTESGPAGYTAGSFSCSGGGTLVGNLLTITAADAGNSITCAVTNTFTVAVPVASIPTLSEWAMIVLAALMAITGFVAMRRKES